MSADVLLSKLDKVRKTGPNSWVACCPAHPDKSPSLSVRDADDGRVLCHCFAGCSIDNILSSVGLTINDLFPARLAYNHGSMRRPFPAHDVLECIKEESQLVYVAACNLARGIQITSAERERLGLAASRIQEAIRLCNGGC